MKLFYLCLLILSCSLGYAEWKPTTQLNGRGYDLKSLGDPAFKDLKQAVAHVVQEKWCTKEKSALIMDLVLLTKPEVCVEIGVFSGSSTVSIAAALKHLDHGKLYAIDPWSNQIAIRHLGAHDPHRGWWAGVDMEKAYENFVHKLVHLDVQSYVTIIQEPSEKALSQIDTINFLHLDGDYSMTFAKKEAENYLAKVKPGGYILLSNVLLMVGGRQPKLPAFKLLFSSCDFIADVDGSNSVLFRKR